MMCPGDGNLISVVGIGVGNLRPYGKKLPGNHAEARRLVERKLFLCNIVFQKWPLKALCCVRTQQ